MSNIKMVDLKGQYLKIKPEIDSAIEKVLESTAFIQGLEVNEFAKSLAAYVGVTHAVTCGNGTDALQIALMALDLKPGDEIILPVHTYVATAEVIALLGLTPVFVDVNEKTFSIDVDEVAKKISVRTRAIVPVHLYGQCADMEPLLTLGREFGIYVIEDAAQALGASYTFSNGTKKKAGAMGIIGTTSFFPSKTLGCFGDGGAIFTNDEALALKIQMISNHGQSIKYHHDLIGVNSRLDTIQAAILQVKLKYLDAYTKKRGEIALAYDERLNSISSVEVPFRAANSTHVFHQYTLRVVSSRRNSLKDKLQDRGVPTMIYYPIPLHFQKAYQKQGLGAGAFPVSERLSETVLSLPVHTELTTSEVEYICSAIEEILRR